MPNSAHAGQSLFLLRRQSLFTAAALLALAALGALRAPPAAAPTLEPPAPTAPTSPTSPTTSPTTAKAPKHSAGKYLSPDSIDFRRLLPDPPATGSPTFKGEIELILAVQADASEAAKARALAEDTLTVWIFSDVLGPSFSPEKMPLSAALLEQAEADSKAITDKAKAFWARSRPSDQDKRIEVRSSKPGNKSYPSGHTTRAAMWAQILTSLAPDRAEKIAARARLVGSDRIVAGVHYPSDVAAGFALGREIAARMMDNPSFKHDLDAARAEWPR